MKIYKIILFLIAINFISCEIVIESIEEIFCDSSELKFKITGSVPEEESPYGSQLTVKLSSPSNTNPSCSYFILGVMLVLHLILKLVVLLHLPLMMK